MSEIADTARATVIVADFINVDAGGKMNIIGAGITTVALDATTGQTSPFYVAALANVDPKFVGQQFSFELALYSHDNGEVVTMPTAVGEGVAIRMGSIVHVPPPQPPPGSFIPPGTIRPGANLLVNFPGLPLAAGKYYEWRASIDGSPVAEAGLLVPGPPPTTFG